MERVAIVGAGIAGLLVARLLTARGARVRVFEKARGAAGRTSTRRLDDGGFERARFDHGAQYVTVRTPAFRAQMDDWLARGVAAPWSARFVALERGAVEHEASAPERFVGVPGMSALARDLAQGLALELAVRIASVERRGGEWLLRSEDGRVFSGFDGLVSAVPAPQAIPLLAASPALVALAQQARLEPCHAVMARFAAPLAVEFDAAFVRAAPLAWVAREASKPDRPPSNDWLLHSTPAFSQAHLDASPEALVAALGGAFAAAVGEPLPAIAATATHRWLYARSVAAPIDAAVFDAALGLGVCGDWLVGSRVEDAYTSAERLVAAIAGAAAQPTAATPGPAGRAA